MEKRGGIALIIITILVVLLIIAGGIIYFSFLYAPSEIVEIPLPKPESLTEADTCQEIIDNYELPDFDNLKETLATNQMVKDTPESSKIVLKLFHVQDDCKIWDKAYMLRDGEIVEKNIEADIEITITSAYVGRLAEEDLCEIISEARDAGDLKEQVNIETSQLAWRYKGMLDHRDCLGL
ncbi:hypothetical protein HOA55_00960 [archaeon]|jgi:hypothetical protein|nr:hypothetical protein [archaeon]MBT3577629.1 hypothetical protein [archaeon]MBT6819905.1 hypothetical protein [archaeon]MBT6956685.1 hypothetical protein [archaeon]MBT7025061.1 hypothetical protein [archaeon]